VKVGVLQFFGWPDRKVPLSSIYDMALERIAIMDRAGFDAVWLAEHHFSSFSVCPSVHMMGMLAAARTTRLRIGTGVSLAPFYNPLRLAEEVALLDVLSGGRVNWGAGRGFSRTEYSAFGIPDAESAPRFREAVDIVLKAWTNERLTYKGQFHSFDNVEVLPRPHQQPHPPVWMAAGSDQAIKWAAGQGHSILLGPHEGRREMARKRRLYRETLEAAGFSDAGRDIPTARLIVVAPTMQEAEAIARRGATWLVDSYIGPQHDRVTYQEHDRQGMNPVDHYVEDVIIHGTPDAVVDRIRELEATIPMNYIMCAPLSRATFPLLTEKVVPRLV
jgi:alkanesulfonate monooxygenase SsuD/methylene tetrahydromethanopterin reductase-like flavin-dependent oxidoreductase (luciferase family)